VVRGCSSDGRALQSHCRGQGFDSPQLHHAILLVFATYRQGFRAGRGGLVIVQLARDFKPDADDEAPVRGVGKGNLTILRLHQRADDGQP
jgi:hypothetical protein